MKALTPAQFKLAMKKEGAINFPKFVVDVQAELVKSVFTNIVLGNPVLTGLSRANWLFSLNQKEEGFVGLGENDAQLTRQPVTSFERERLAKFLVMLQSHMMGQKAFITNNIPYIVDLEEGTSRKAPHGMVELGILQAILNTRAQTKFIEKKAKAR